MLYTAVKAAALLVAVEASAPASTSASCRDIKVAYQGSSCCSSNLAQTTNYVVEAAPSTIVPATNPCAGAKPYHANATAQDYYFRNTNCTLADMARNTLEQAGANVTAGYQGLLDTGDRQPITTTYFEAGLCPVNVHWHLGAEHYSAGQYDETGSGPTSPGRRRLHSESEEEFMEIVKDQFDENGRRLASSSSVRMGFQCKHYDAADAKFTTPYNWQYCTGMQVGQTYEVHWPHSAAGACHTPNQYQTPFYDGVFCRGGIISLSPLNTFQKIGVQSQVFTIVNDEHYYWPDLIKGAVVEGPMWSDVAKYTGSTTGTSRDNTVCSRYTPITWQVDRTCHMVSASSFDKMCKDMLAQRDDMSNDLHAHGARELVSDYMAANNQQRRE